MRLSGLYAFVGGNLPATTIPVSGRMNVAHEICVLLALAKDTC